LLFIFLALKAGFRDPGEKQVAKQCAVCGKPLSFLSRGDLCSACRKTIKAATKEMKAEVLLTGCLQDKHLDLLKRLDKEDALKLYDQLYEKFTADRELEDRENETLQKLQKAAALSDAEVRYNDKVLPYVYASFIKNKGRVPEADITLPPGQTLILKKDEVTHFANATTVKELRSVAVGYEGRSAGGSIRIMPGAYFRLGGYGGHVLKEDRLVPVSQGLLVLTNKRLLLSPAAGCRALSIPLESIFSLSSYENGFEIGVEGRTKSFFFAMSSGAAEIFSMSLNHILGK
jgi:hypothetical protein